MELGRLCLGNEERFFLLAAPIPRAWGPSRRAPTRSFFFPLHHSRRCSSRSFYPPCISSHLRRAQSSPAAAQRPSSPASPHRPRPIHRVLGTVRHLERRIRPKDSAISSRHRLPHLSPGGEPSDPVLDRKRRPPARVVGGTRTLRSDSVELRELL